MSTVIESLATTILLILLILLFLHMINGTAVDWITSKVQATDDGQ